MSTFRKKIHTVKINQATTYFLSVQNLKLFFFRFVILNDMYFFYSQKDKKIFNFIFCSYFIFIGSSFYLINNSFCCYDLNISLLNNVVHISINISYFVLYRNNLIKSENRKVLYIFINNSGRSIEFSNIRPRYRSQFSLVNS